MPDNATAAPDGGPALFRLVRYWSRRWTGEAARELTGEMRHVPHILAVEAVRTAAGHGEDATVATVAHQLGIDRSGASRVVRDAVAAGYLTRDVAAGDRRRAALQLTAAGHDLLDAAHRWQRTAFADLTASWPTEDRDRFAAYLTRLAAEVGA